MQTNMEALMLQLGHLLHDEDVMIHSLSLF